jgi:hypothetical protein
MNRATSAAVEQHLIVRTPGYRVAVTGHQNLGDHTAVQFVEQQFGIHMAAQRDTHPEGIVALSGLAAGADTIFAELAVRGNIPLEVCLAAPDILENFVPGIERERFLTLCAMSRHIHRLPFSERSNEAYMGLGHWLVESCDLLIAAWNGKPATGLGGTGDVVAYAQKLGRPVIHVHPVERVVRRLG